MFERATLARALPFLCYIFFIFVADMAGRVGYSAAELRYLYPVKMAAVLALLLWFRRDYTELAWQALPARMVAIIVATGIIVLVLWVTLDAGWMTVGQAGGFDPRQDGAISWPLVAVRIAGAALVVPVMEELFWRSFLMRWIAGADYLRIDPAAVGWKALLVTVVLFGFEHNLWLAGIVAGAAYSVLYMRSRNLWTAILAHAVTNGALGVWIVCTSQWTYW